jgi:hypothetical protein
MSTLSDLDRELAGRHGSYASYPTEADPLLVETYGDNPADEVDRLLDQGVLLLRRAVVDYVPVAPELKPLE